MQPAVAGRLGKDHTLFSLRSIKAVSRKAAKKQKFAPDKRFSGFMCKSAFIGHF
jgi:hypothetical protein